ncbi:alpha/beta hydrolase fold protein [Tanacetum coccineum]
MAPIKCRTKHKPEKTKVGEEVLDIVISYIHDVEDRNSVSLVSRKFYEIDGITRKSVTLHTLYSNPSRLSKRFPFIESLTLKGPPSGLNQRYHHHIKITPWIQQLALEFRCLKELHIRRLVVHDEDLETLVRTRGKDLRSLKIKKCKGISTDGLMHISKYCNQLRALCLEYDRYHIEAKNETWLHQLALNSTVLEMFQFKYTDLFDAEGLVALAKGCTKLECLMVRLEDISNEAIEFVGTHLKNIRKFRIHLDKKDGTTYLPLDNGFRAMLMGCNNLESEISVSGMED